MTATTLPVQIAQSVPRKDAKRRAILKAFPHLDFNDRCLDIGTSHGGLAWYFARQGAWTFLDIDSENLKIASAVLKGEFVEEDAMSYVQTHRGYRLVSCIDTIQYFSEPEAFIRSMHEALLPGGYFLVSGVQRQPHTLVYMIRKSLGLEKACGFAHDLQCEALETLCTRNGFKLERVEHFCGPVTFLFQTLLDKLKTSSPGEGEGSDGLTLGGQQLKSLSTSKLLALRILRICSYVTQTLDDMLPFFSRHGFVLLLRKYQ